VIKIFKKIKNSEQKKRGIQHPSPAVSPFCWGVISLIRNIKKGLPPLSKGHKKVHPFTEIVNFCGRRTFLRKKRELS